MRRLLLLIAVLALAGCANLKAKRHGLFCVGACIHMEGEIAKEKGDTPKDAAPEPAETPES